MTRTRRAHSSYRAASGRSFQVDPGEAILAAAIRQGIGMPYGCKDGACGSCKCRKLEGRVKHGCINPRR